LSDPSSTVSVEAQPTCQSRVFRGVPLRPAANQSRRQSACSIRNRSV